MVNHMNVGEDENGNHYRIDEDGRCVYTSPNGDPIDTYSLSKSELFDSILHELFHVYMKRQGMSRHEYSDKECAKDFENVYCRYSTLGDTFIE